MPEKRCPGCGQQVEIQLKGGAWYYNDHKIKGTNNWCLVEKKVKFR